MADTGNSLIRGPARSQIPFFKLLFRTARSSLLLPSFGLNVLKNKYTYTHTYVNGMYMRCDQKTRWPKIFARVILSLAQKYYLTSASDSKIFVVETQCYRDMVFVTYGKKSWFQMIYQIDETKMKIIWNYQKNDKHWQEWLFLIISGEALTVI